MLRPSENDYLSTLQLSENYAWASHFSLHKLIWFSPSQHSDWNSVSHPIITVLERIHKSVWLDGQYPEGPLQNTCFTASSSLGWTRPSVNTRSMNFCGIVCLCCHSKALVHTAPVHFIIPMVALTCEFKNRSVNRWVPVILDWDWFIRQMKSHCLSLYNHYSTPSVSLRTVDVAQLAITNKVQTDQ